MVEKEKPTEEYRLVEIPTQTGLAFQTPSGEIMNLEQAIVDLLNKVNEIKKAIK